MTASTQEPQLGSSFAKALAELGLDWQADAAPTPEAVIVNAALAKSLGLDVDWLTSSEGTAFFAGTNLPDGAKPIAMAYAGHQFGGYSPRLGDGRALLLGELSDDDGNLVDLHLKGSGRTPFSRGGDGLATLQAMLREYLMAEAMHALLVPTSRALAVVTTGNSVQRDKLERGAVLTRIAKSHIRVGTFEYAVRHDPELVPALVDYTIERHYPDLAGAEVRPLALLEAVATAQAKLIAKWMTLGFVHGVMNTDNVLLSGETIDYGPCAFLEAHDPTTVFSSIDRNGRYAYANQPMIGQWNLARFAETMLGFIDSDEKQSIAKATTVLEAYTKQFDRFWTEEMAAKIGLDGRHDDLAVAALTQDLVAMMASTNADHTLTFRTLADELRGSASESFALMADDGWPEWSHRWRTAIGDGDLVEVAAAMDAVNPLYVPRNHLVEEALAAAGEGDLDPFHRLLEVTTSPFEQHDDRGRFAQPAPDGFTENYRTFCGT